ncbi:hypothetical protein AALF15_12260 [Corynebacteriaceae bacterium 7-707]
MSNTNLDKALADAKEKAAAARAKVRELNRKKREAERRTFERQALAIGRRVLTAAKESHEALVIELSVLSDELTEEQNEPAEDAGTGAQHPDETDDVYTVNDTQDHAQHDHAQAESNTAQWGGVGYA